MDYDWKRSVFIPIPNKGNAKECSNYHTIALISHASKIMLKILQARLQQYMNCEFSDVQAGFRKGRGIRDQIANMSWIIKKTKEFQKTSTCALLIRKILWRREWQSIPVFLPGEFHRQRAWWATFCGVTEFDMTE